VRRRYVLAPEAALDLVQIWRFIKNNASLEMADRVESAIREKIGYLAGRPGRGPLAQGFKRMHQ
jgi:plasmid stabilization system protein ParE